MHLQFITCTQTTFPTIHCLPPPALYVQLLLHLVQLGLQGSDGGLELGAALAFHILELGLEVPVVPLKLLPGALSCLGGGALRLKLLAKLLNLRMDGKEVGKGRRWVRGGLGTRRIS